MSGVLTFSMIQEAKKTIGGVIRRTPLVECPALEEALGGSIYLKMENLQKTGSFKIRGAINKISSLTDEEKARGVIAASAGNHAQGVALGAKAQGIKATIAMPATAPMAKVAATRSYGAEVVLNGEVYDDAYAKACEIQKESGAVFLHPFDDEYVMAGQGTIGLEILEDVADLDVVVVPIGGGGILAGIAMAVKNIKPSIKVIGVQTDNVPSMREALKVGESIVVDATPTIADGIAVRKAGTKTFQVIKEYVDDVITVSESEIAKSILFLMEKSKVVAEGAGATAVAALLAGKVDTENKKVCAIISGGNIDINLVDRVINKALFDEGRRADFRVKIINRSGELQKILDILKKIGVNVLFLNGSMYQSSLIVNHQELHIVAECADMEQKKELYSNLTTAGYVVY